MPSFVRSKLSNLPLSQQQASETRPASIGLTLSQVRAVLDEYGGISEEEEGKAESEILLTHLLGFGTTELFTSLRAPFPPERLRRSAFQRLRQQVTHHFRGRRKPLRRRVVSADVRFRRRTPLLGHQGPVLRVLRERLGQAREGSAVEHADRDGHHRGTLRSPGRSPRAALLHSALQRRLPAAHRLSLGLPVAAADLFGHGVRRVDDHPDLPSKPPGHEP